MSHSAVPCCTFRLWSHIGSLKSEESVCNSCIIYPTMECLSVNTNHGFDLSPLSIIFQIFLSKMDKESYTASWNIVLKSRSSRIILGFFSFIDLIKNYLSRSKFFSSFLVFTVTPLLPNSFISKPTQNTYELVKRKKRKKRRKFLIRAWRFS